MALERHDSHGVALDALALRRERHLPSGIPEEPAEAAELCRPVLVNEKHFHEITNDNRSRPRRPAGKRLASAGRPGAPPPRERGGIPLYL